MDESPQWQEALKATDEVLGGVQQILDNFAIAGEDDGRLYLFCGTCQQVRDYDNPIAIGILFRDMMSHDALHILEKVTSHLN